MSHQKCISCGKITLTKSHTSRPKKYCNNQCQIDYEKRNGLRSKFTPISKEVLEKMYKKEKMSCTQISKRIGISGSHVSRLLKRYKIKARLFSTKGLQPRLNAILSKNTKNKIAKSHTGKKLSFEHRRKIRENAKYGENNKAWKGGITPINKRIRSSVEYRLWRLSVFERDSFTCRECGQKGGELHADHIKQFAYYEHLRFVLSNGRTLCVKCHKKTETYGRNILVKLSNN